VLLQYIEIKNELLLWLIRRMGVEAEIQGYFKEGELHLDVERDSEGVLVGRHGRTLEAREILINRMVNRRVNEPVRVVFDIGGYLRRQTESLEKLAGRLGERAKKEGKTITVGPLKAQERIIIHLSLQRDPRSRQRASVKGL
jgi:spoIIIJ-associated protein